VACGDTNFGLLHDVVRNSAKYELPMPVRIRAHDDQARLRYLCPSEKACAVGLVADANADAAKKKKCRRLFIYSSPCSAFA
jgi:hypothetical protein